MKIQADIIVIGGGASGFFAAITAAEEKTGKKIILLEKSSKLLSKVRVSGGGRCNVTNAERDLQAFSKSYPRGEKVMRKLLGHFGPEDTVAWFEKRGVKIKAEADGRMFPVSNSSETIIHCLMMAADKAGVEIKTGMDVQKIEYLNGQFNLRIRNGDLAECKNLFIASGGFPKKESFDWLSELGHEIISPLPSLFTFNIADNPLKGLEGLAVENATVGIDGVKSKITGPVLVTHWGLSGPAVLKTSAFAARDLAALNYNYTVKIDWLSLGENGCRAYLENLMQISRNAKVINAGPEGIPKRLWERLCALAGNESDKKWAEISKAYKNKLVVLLSNMEFSASGKTTYKEEFVTTGGITLKEIKFPEMESRIIPGLYFGGEVLDVDGITGGFNFQAAWTTGYLAGRSMSKN